MEETLCGGPFGAHQPSSGLSHSRDLDDCALTLSAFDLVYERKGIHPPSLKTDSRRVVCIGARQRGSLLKKVH